MLDDLKKLLRMPIGADSVIVHGDDVSDLKISLTRRNPINQRIFTTFDLNPYNTWQFFRFINNAQKKYIAAATAWNAYDETNKMEIRIDGKNQVKITVFEKGIKYIACVSWKKFHKIIMNHAMGMLNKLDSNPFFDEVEKWNLHFMMKSFDMKHNPCYNAGY